MAPSRLVSPAILIALFLGVLSLLSVPALGAQTGAHRASTHTRHLARCSRSASLRVSHRGPHGRRHRPACPKRQHSSHHTRTHSHTQPGAHGTCSDTQLVPNAENLIRIRTATLCLVNRERARHGEAPLHPNAQLERAARGHSDNMAVSDYFDHVSPNGVTPLARMRSAGYIYSSRIGFEVGENIAWGTLWLATPRAIVAGWMASPGHRANILDRNFRDTAIGVSPRAPAALAHGQHGGIYTQDFGVIVTD